jgi:hypothetical protein
MADGVSLKEKAGEGRFFTYADYKNWNPAEIGRYELIYGIARHGRAERPPPVNAYGTV